MSYPAGVHVQSNSIINIDIYIPLQGFLRKNLL